MHWGAVEEGERGERTRAASHWVQRQVSTVAAKVQTNHVSVAEADYITTVLHFTGLLSRSWNQILKVIVTNSNILI